MKEEYVFENSFSRSGTLCTSGKGASRDTPWVLLLSKGSFLFSIRLFTIFLQMKERNLLWTNCEIQNYFKYICIAYRRCACVAYIWYMMLYSMYTICVYSIYILCDANKEYMWCFCIACIEYMWFFICIENSERGTARYRDKHTPSPEPEDRTSYGAGYELSAPPHPQGVWGKMLTKQYTWSVRVIHET